MRRRTARAPPSAAAGVRRGWRARAEANGVARLDGDRSLPRTAASDVQSVVGEADRPGDVVDEGAACQILNSRKRERSGRVGEDAGPADDLTGELQCARRLVER